MVETGCTTGEKYFGEVLRCVVVVVVVVVSLHRMGKCGALWAAC